jgi:hypothetical protein
VDGDLEWRGGWGSRADGGGGGEWNANTRFLVRCFEKMLGTPKKDMNTIKYTLRIKRLISERRVVNARNIRQSTTV